MEENKRNIIIKEMPEELRPRERLMKYGVIALSDYELLAIILRTGTKELSVLELARKVIIQFQNLGEFRNITINELCRIKGIKEAKAVEILAAIEFGKRIGNYVRNKVIIKSSNDVYLYIKNELEGLDEERLVCIYLNTKCEVIEKKIISIGTINSTSFDFKKVLRWALKLNAIYIVLVHNHPTGDPIPSKQDIQATKEAVKASSMFDIKIIDHVIIGDNKYFSFKEKNIF